MPYQGYDQMTTKLVDAIRNQRRMSGEADKVRQQRQGEMDKYAKQGANWGAGSSLLQTLLGALGAAGSAGMLGEWGQGASPFTQSGGSGAATTPQADPFDSSYPTFNDQSEDLFNWSNPRRPGY